MRAGSLDRPLRGPPAMAAPFLSFELPFDSRAKTLEGKRWTGRRTLRVEPYGTSVEFCPRLPAHALGFPQGGLIGLPSESGSPLSLAGGLHRRGKPEIAGPTRLQKPRASFEFGLTPLQPRRVLRLGDRIYGAVPLARYGRVWAACRKPAGLRGPASGESTRGKSGESNSRRDVA